MDKEKGIEGEKKTGFTGFSTKKDETCTEKKDEKPVGLGLGEKGLTPLLKYWTDGSCGEACRYRVKGDVLQGMKNKTMEEIINKWTGELDRCGEQFKTQVKRYSSLGRNPSRKRRQSTSNPKTTFLMVDCKIIHSNSGSNTSPRPYRHSTNLHRRFPIRTLPPY